MIIHCTKKLLSELRIKELSEELETDSFWSWHGNIITIERRKCVLLVNNSTLYTLFIPALRKPDFEAFHLIFGQSLFKNLFHEEIPQAHVELVLSKCEHLSFAKSNNRSVLGSMNEQKKLLDYYLWQEGGLAYTNILALNKELNRNVLTNIDPKRPIQALKQKLKAMANRAVP